MCCIPLRLRYLVFCVLISRLDVGVGRHAEYGLDPPATEQRVSGALHSSDAALLIESSGRPNVALAGTLERDSTTGQTYC